MATNIAKNIGEQNRRDNFLLTFENLYFVNNYHTQIK